MKSKKRLIVEVDPNLHREFKKMCISNNESINSVMNGFVVKYLADHKKNIIY